MIKCLQLKIDSKICQPRHSHSLASWKDNVVISGGVDQYENPLNEIIIFNMESFKMEKLNLKNGKVLPRFLI